MEKLFRDFLGINYYKNFTTDVMGVTFVPPEPGGHFCPAKQLIEGDGNFQISRWKKIPDLSFFLYKINFVVICRFRMSLV